MLRDRYENEIKNLKTLIRRQQKQLEDMVNDKRYKLKLMFVVSNLRHLNFKPNPLPIACAS